MNSGSSTPSVVYLVAIDGTPAGDHVVDVAAGLVAALGGSAELHVLHVLAVPASPTAAGVLGTSLLEAGRLALDRATGSARSRCAGRIVGHLAAGDTTREIVQKAANLGADLVLVGTAGRTGLARLALGSVAEQVVRRAGCPVLVVRPKDHHAGTEQDVGIEPPCPDCLAVQQSTARQQLWCERHSARHPQGRLHYELPPSFAVGSMNFRP